MNALIVEASDYSPKVILDPTQNIFEFSGESRPENTSKFYVPILQWLEEYQKVLVLEQGPLEQRAQRTFEFKFDYFHSTSAKFIMDVLMQLDDMAQQGCNIKIKWHYDKINNEDMKESGEKFSQLLKKLTMEFVVI